MAGCRPLPVSALLLLSLVFMIAPVGLPAHGPSERHEEGSAHDAAAMKAQHERMGRFLEAMQGLSNAIILGDLKSARENTDKLAAALAGNEKDAPHANRARRGEFRALYAELGRRIAALRTALQTGNLSRGGAAYGRVLEVCASCHREFRS